MFKNSYFTIITSYLSYIKVWAENKMEVTHNNYSGSILLLQFVVLILADLPGGEIGMISLNYTEIFGKQIVILYESD